MRVSVPTSGLKLGDVLKGANRFYVVTETYANRLGLPEAAVLCSDERTSARTDTPGSVSGLHLKVGEGCAPTIEALRRFIEHLEAGDIAP